MKVETIGYPRTHGYKLFGLPPFLHRGGGEEEDVEEATASPTWLWLDKGQ